MPIYQFDENNSGGSWWLNKEQYEKLLAAGWTNEPGENEPGEVDPDFERVPWSWRHNFKFEAGTIREAIESWEAATGENFFTGGCPCCGPPFSISSEYGENFESMSGGYEDFESMSGGYEEISRPW
jgi:hypothetical protein